MLKLIQNIHVFAPEDIGINDILISGSTILDISPTIDITYKSLEIIDGSSLTAFPGLVDQHVHITGGGGENGFNSRVPEISISSIVSSGVTTVIGLLGHDTSTNSVASLLAKAKELNLNGISAYCLTGGYTFPSVKLTDSIHDDIAFIDEILGLKIALADHRSSYPTVAEMTRVATEVRTAGLLSGKKSYIHLHMGKDTLPMKVIESVLKHTTLPISLFRPTHCSKMFSESIDFINKGGYIDFTASENTGDFIGTIKKAVKLAHDPSRITISSDSNGSMPVWDDGNNIVSISSSQIGTLYKTLKEMIRSYHFSVTDSLHFFTDNSAKALGLYPRKGCLKAGSDADIVLVDRDYDIHSVLAKGDFMVKRKQILKTGLFETLIKKEV